VSRVEAASSAWSGAGLAAVALFVVLVVVAFWIRMRS
jgi:hypothetical protein